LLLRDAVHQAGDETNRNSALDANLRRGGDGEPLRELREVVPCFRHLKEQQSLGESLDGSERRRCVRNELRTAETSGCLGERDHRFAPEGEEVAIESAIDQRSIERIVARRNVEEFLERLLSANAKRARRGTST